MHRVLAQGPWPLFGSAQRVHPEGDATENGLDVPWHRVGLRRYSYSALPSASTRRGTQRNTGSMLREQGWFAEAPGHYSALPSASTQRGMQRKTGSMLRGQGWFAERSTGFGLKAPGHYSALPSASTPRGTQRKTGPMFRGAGLVCGATRIRLCPAHPPRGGCNGKRARCCEARVGVRGDTVVILAEGDRSLTLMEFAMRNHSPSSAQRVRVNPGPSEGNSVRGALSATDPRADRLNFGCALKPSSGTTPGQLPSERGDWCSSTGQALSHFAVRKGSTRGLSPGTNKQGHTQACKHFSKRATGRKEPFRSRAPGKPRGNQDETK